MSSTAVDLGVVAEGTLWGKGVRGYSGVPSSAPAPLGSPRRGGGPRGTDSLTAVTRWSTMSSPRLALGFSFLVVQRGPGRVASHILSGSDTCAGVLDGTPGMKNGRQASRYRASLGLYSGRGQTLPT